MFGSFEESGIPLALRQAVRQQGIVDARLTFRRLAGSRVGPHLPNEGLFLGGQLDSIA